MLVSLGLDFRQARLDVRERFHLDDADGPIVTSALRAAGAQEVVIARTCNRTEVHCWWPDTHERPDHEVALGIAVAWSGARGAEATELAGNARLRRGADAARHVLRVAAGLESQILGDIHILGQIRRAFRDAIATGSIGSHLHRLFEAALRVGKQVKRETLLQSSRTSVGAAAAHRAAARLGVLAERRCVVVGCGKSGTHAARALVSLGAKRLTVVNRSFDRAEKLARELGAQPAGLDSLAPLLATAELVIVATGAPDPVVRSSALAVARAEVTAAPALVVIDVSMPRNVEPNVGELPGVALIDLDALHPEAADVERARLDAVPQAEARVERGLAEFVEWLDLASARASLRPLHDALRAICEREVSHLAGHTPSAERTAERIVARLIARPMAALRAASARGERLDAAAIAIESLFATRDCTSRGAPAQRSNGDASRPRAIELPRSPRGEALAGSDPAVRGSRRPGPTIAIDTLASPPRQ